MTNRIPDVVSKAAALVAIVLVVVLALGVVQPPVVTVLGDSMEPTYSTGDVILVSPVDASTLEEGDIAVVDVSPSVEDQYGYPDTIVHRIAAIDRSGAEVLIRTAGDNSGEDPFTVQPVRVTGTPRFHVPYVGYLYLYLRSVEGKLFLATAAVVYVYYFYWPPLYRRVEERVVEPLRRLSELQNGAGRAHTRDESIEEMQAEIAEMRDEMDDVQRSMSHFAYAVEEYAKHIESHTDAVQNMSQAAEDIQSSVEHQTRVLDQLESELDGGSRNEPSTDESAERNDATDAEDTEGNGGADEH